MKNGLISIVDQKLTDHINDEGKIWDKMKISIEDIKEHHLSGLNRQLNEANLTIAKTRINMDNIEKTTTRIEKTLNDFIEKADGKFASKWVEKLVYAILLAMATLFIGGAWAIITKKI